MLGNPPWDTIRFKSTRSSLQPMTSKSSMPLRNASRIADRAATAGDPEVRHTFEHYIDEFEQCKRMQTITTYQYQKVQVDGDLAGRQLDEFRVFMERNAQLLAPDGVTGVVVPSAFHANEGATGVRRLYLEQMGLQCCYSFENRRSCSRSTAASSSPWWWLAGKARPSISGAHSTCTMTSGCSAKQRERADVCTRVSEATAGIISVS